MSLGGRGKAADTQSVTALRPDLICYLHANDPTTHTGASAPDPRGQTAVPVALLYIVSLGASAHAVLHDHRSHCSVLTVPSTLQFGSDWPRKVHLELPLETPSVLENGDISYMSLSLCDLPPQPFSLLTPKVITRSKL